MTSLPSSSKQSSVQQQQSPRVSEMDLPPIPGGPESTFDWSDFFDFNIDEELIYSLEESNQLQSHPPSPPSPAEMPSPNLPPNPAESTDRVRKRDPRLVCSNFLAGRVPCACPEMDAKMEAAEEGPQRSKKRPRVGRRVGTVRCQVPGCEVDIGELKGYHRRHRVCLQCAHASSVVLDGQSKRYCQQCGKFHLLPDFDEGKRSCRRKLERHNNRRRRKPAGSCGALEKEPQEDLKGEDVSSDVDAGKDNICSSNQIAELEEPLDSKDGTMSNQSSGPDSQNIQSDSIFSFSASGQFPADEGKDDFKYAHSPLYFNDKIVSGEGKVHNPLVAQESLNTRGDSVVTFAASHDYQLNGQKDDAMYAHSPALCDNRSVYTSVCPTGRISFKLYDWNPAEFPRHLRHQIFQWLSSMPVELEGYIRPGCTILTTFAAMPQFMWMKLFEDPSSCVKDVITHGGMLYGRGLALAYLNNKIFRVLRDGVSIMEVKVAVQAPKLHYVYPSFFEAGKPMEFIACGSNLVQPKFRSLISFAGKYLQHEFYVAFPRKDAECEAPLRCDHQICRISVPHTDPDFFGPAFIEVENESGLSNFLPVLVGDEQVCSEMKKIEQKYDACSCGNKSSLQAYNSVYERCMFSSSRQKAISEFMLDVAWLLRQNAADNLQQHVTSSFQIRRFNCLLDFLINNESISILERMCSSLSNVLDEVEGMDSNTRTGGIANADRKFFQKSMVLARDLVNQKQKKDEGLCQDDVVVGNFSHQISRENDPLSILQDLQMRGVWNSAVSVCSTSEAKGETIPLLMPDVAMDVNDSKDWPRKSCNLVISNRIIGPRPLVYMAAAIAVCCGLCTVLFHPEGVGRLAVSIRRCLFDDSV